MKNRFVTRAEYDWLVILHADWMLKHWTRDFARRWSLSGVMVTGDEAHVMILVGMLPSHAPL